MRLPRGHVTTVVVTLLLLTTATGSAVAGGAGQGTGLADHSDYHYECSFPVSATDATGTEVTVEGQPERVTVLGASAAQTMWEIGGKEQVVGLGQYALYLEGAESRTNVSASGFGYNVEKVVGTQPDLVLAANIVSNATVKKLRQAGLTVYKFRAAATVADVRAKTKLTGKLTGNCEGAARTNKWMMQNVKTARTVTAGVDKPGVLVPLGSGYFAAGDTFISDLIRVAGGENLAAAEYSGYPQLSDEVVLQLDPSVLVLQPWATYMLNQEPYASTTAGQNNASVVVETRYLNQPAPRSVVMTTRTLVEGFHPDAYAEAEWEAKSEVTLATPTPTPTETGAMTETDTETATSTATPSPTETSGPGFGAVAALVSLLAGALLLGRR